MVYTKKNNRIQDPNQINYVKSILEASAQQCQQGGMYTPEIYIATAQRIVDSTPDLDIDREMAELISSFDGDLEQLNDRLKVHKLQINLSEERQRLSVSEMDNGIAFPVFSAEADGEGWKVASQINDSTKMDILERFVEAEEAVLANAKTQPEQANKSEKVIEEEPSLFL